MWKCLSRQIGLKFQCRGRIREVGESQRGLRRLKLLAQWWTGCPDSMARALWKKDAGRGTLGVPMMPFWQSSMNQVNPASRVAGRLTNKYGPRRCWLRRE